MIRRIVTLLVVLAIAYAGYHLGMVFFHEQEFQDAVRNIALFGAGKSDDVLKDSVMSAAADNSIPLDADYIEISRQSIVGSNDHVVIKYDYALMVPIFLRYERRFEFEYKTP